MSADCASIIDRVIEERKKRDMTQSQLAEASGFTQSVIARFEGKKVMPQINTLCRILEALDCTVDIVPKDQQ